MSEKLTEQEAPQREVVSVNFDAFTKDHSDQPLEKVTSTEKPAEEVVVEKPVIENVENKPAEPTAEEKAKEIETLKTEAKDLGLAETATKEEVATAKEAKLNAEKPIIEFKAEDILKDITSAEEGTWLRVAQDAKIEGVTEDSFDAFQKAVVAPYVKQLEDLKASAKIDYFATLKPETATNFKLLEMGYSEEQLFAPTREIDSYLSLSPAELIRADYELRAKQGEAWTNELIDAKMEELAADPKKLQLADAELRIILNNQKGHILQERTQLVQQFETQKEQAVLRQKELDVDSFKKALTTVDKFMDRPVKQEIKDAIFKKFTNGGYDNDLTSANAKVEYVLHKELAPQLIKSLQNTAYENGRDEKAKKLHNIPIVTNSSVGQRVETNNQLKENDNFAAFLRDHS